MEFRLKRLWAGESHSQGPCNLLPYNDWYNLQGQGLLVHHVNHSTFIDHWHLAHFHCRSVSSFVVSSTIK
jgi:hypothetical protein